MMGKTIYSVMLKSLALKTGSQTFGCQLKLVGLLLSRFSSETDEQKQVLQETMIYCFTN